MSQVKISVIIPVYNNEKYLQRCMESVLGQTLREIEIILVDDGSSDSSVDLCNVFAQQDDRVRVVHKQNEGAGYARNSGLDLVTGEYVAFVDSDDYVDVCMYESLYTFAKKNQADTCACGYCRVKDETVVKKNKGGLSGVYRDADVLSQVYLNLLGSEPRCTEDWIVLWQSPCFCLYSLQLIRQYGTCFVSEREFVSEDHLFNMDYFRHARCVYITNETYYYYCENKQSLTQTYRTDRFQQMTKIYRETLRRVQAEEFDQEFFAEAKMRLQRAYLAKARSCIARICDTFPSYAKARNHILPICSEPELQAVLAEYPWKQNPLKLRVFNWGLQHQSTFYLYWLRSFRRFIR